MERIQKILSSHGIASRREAERMIIDGRVAVNGKTASLGESADEQWDIVSVDGKPIREKDEHVYIMLYKPKGYITTLSDEKGRKTAAELVSDCGRRVYPVGRLDYNSEGLLFFTNDGSFANQMMHPASEKLKVYRVNVLGSVDKSVGPLLQPMDIDGAAVRADDVEIVQRTPKGGVLMITIHEGRNRQIRKMCQKCGLEVTRLVRVSEGGISVGDLKPGQWRYLSKSEVHSLLK